MFKTTEIDVADWREDARFMIERMEKVHPNLYEANGRDAWAEAAAQLEKQLESTTFHETVMGFIRLAAMAPDGHTGVWSYPRGSAFDRRYPIRYDSFADGFFVRSTIDRYRELFGKRIVALNGTPIEEALRAVRPYVSADNDMGAMVQRVENHISVPIGLTMPEVLHAAGLTRKLEYAAELTVEESDGGRNKVTLEALPGDSTEELIEADEHFGTQTPKPIYRRVDRNYSYAYLREHRLLYVNFRSVQDEEDEPFAEFCDRVFRFVDANNVEKFVLDIRSKHGGNLYLNQPMAHGLISSRKVNKPGRLFVVIGRVTFSAAMHLAAEVERNTHALFVGEPTGARPNFYSDVVRFSLPVSGIEVICSELYWQNSDPRDDRQWILPDIPAPESYADFVMHRDPALEAIIEYDGGASNLQEERTPNRNWYRPSQKIEPPD